MLTHMDIFIVISQQPNLPVKMLLTEKFTLSLFSWYKHVTVLLCISIFVAVWFNRYMDINMLILVGPTIR